MTSSAAENYFIYATITLASVTSPGSTLSVYVSNRPYENGGNIYKPIIRSLNGIAYGMGAYVPRTSSGSISLDDSPHSYGFERRLSDLLERYSVLDQEIEIGIRLGTDLDDHVGTSGTAAVIFRGLILDWKKDVSSQSLTLRVKGEDLPRTVMTRSINSTDFPSAPAESLGKNLPIVFGTNVDVKPVLISAKGSTAPDFAYSTALKDQFISGGVQTYYAKNHEGRYVAVKSVTAAATAVFKYDAGASSFTAVSGREYIFPFTTPSDGGYIITRVSPIDDDKVRRTYRIYDVKPDPSGSINLYGASRTVIGEAQDNRDGVVSLPDLYDATFKNPVVLEPDRTYYIGIYYDPVVAGNTTTFTYNAAAGTATYFYRDIANGESAPWRAASGNKYAWALFGVKFTDTTSGGTNNAGLGYSKISLEQSDSSNEGLYQSKMSLTNLDLVLSVNGLKDVNGYITTAGSVITRPDHAIELLTRYYASSTWNNPTLDTTFFSDSTTGVSTSNDRYYRTVGGRSDGRALAAQIIEDIGKSCAVRVGLAISSTAGRRFTRFCWSTNRPTSAVFTNRNSNIIEIEQRDAATVINRATVFNGESLRGLSVESGSAENSLRNYSNVAETYNGLDTTATALTSESVTLYGERPNAAAGYKFLGSGGRMMSDYLCALFGRPHIYVTLETEARFYARECLEVVEILHPEVFAYFGTSADPGASTFAGTAVDPASGQYIVRAQTYRGQIEGKEFIFTDNQSPKIRFTIRLLNNYPSDPT